jgi:hypothetical protein
VTRCQKAFQAGHQEALVRLDQTTILEDESMTSDHGLPDKPSSRVAALLDKAEASHRATAKAGRLVFVVDATGSRQPSWDIASKIQADMFTEAAKVGVLDIMLIYFHGVPDHDGACMASRWTRSASELASFMAKVQCRFGPTQIKKVLERVGREHQQQPVSACIYIGDVVEDPAQALYDLAGSIGVRLFIFQEGEDVFSADVFRRMARLSGGAHRHFNINAVSELADLLRAVAAFSVGGLEALSDLKSDAAIKLLGQLKK